MEGQRRIIRRIIADRQNPAMAALASRQLLLQ
jgi:hypothetical protein